MELLRQLKAFYAKHKRAHLPWRKTKDPYRILVSEVMLQQTQVDRVISYYGKFIKQFPTAETLAKAPLSKVLLAWQGLGYNRRAKYLRDAAAIMAKEGFGDQKLPGVGPYTRGAIMAFAFNKPEIFIETNIRTVFFYHHKIIKKTSDRQILPLIAAALKRSNMEPREFYWAMMDYGSHLKRRGVRLNRTSKHYAKQGKFEGSPRQLRGAIVRELLKGPSTLSQLTKKLSRNRGEVEREALRLSKEGLISRSGKRLLLH